VLRGIRSRRAAVWRSGPGCEAREDFAGEFGQGDVGALLATAVAFSPSFAFVLLGARHFDTLRGNARVQAFLTGAGPAVIGAITGSAIPCPWPSGTAGSTSCCALPPCGCWPRGVEWSRLSCQPPRVERHSPSQA
jgi:hypothetical protein